MAAATKRKREAPPRPPGPPALAGAPAPPGGAEGLQQFRKAVQELKTKSQSKITNLTALAASLYELALDVTQILAEEITIAHMSRLQPLISVVDSILKKVGKDYKTHFSARMPEILQGAVQKSDSAIRGWLQKMVSESWRKHDLLIVAVLDVLDSIFLQPLGQAPVGPEAAPLPPPSGAPPPALAEPPAAHAAAPLVVGGPPTAPTLTAAGAPAPQSVGTPPRAAAPVPQPILQAPLEQQPPLALVGTLAEPVPAATAATAAAVAWAPAEPAATPARAVTGAAGVAQAEASRQPRAGPAPPTKAPPPARAEAARPPASAELMAARGQAAAARLAGPAGPQPSPASDGPALVERRLTILSKIIERKSPGHEELQEIMKVPEIRKAIAMQQKGQRQEAMALLSQFKQELERKHSQYSEASKEQPDLRPSDPRPHDPRHPEPKQPDPRQPEPRPVDLRQPEAESQDARPVDPRQPEAKPLVDPRPADPRQAERRQSGLKQSDPRQRNLDAAPRAVHQAVDGSVAMPGGALGLGGTGKRSSEAQVADLRQKQQRVLPPGSQQAAAGESVTLEAVSGDEAERQARAEPYLNGQGLAPARQVLQGLPSIGFSEAWLRQFMEQLPTRGSPDEAHAVEVPSVGRKVLGASGEQMVYVDELSPNEMLLLLQLIFLLEERLRRTGGGIEIAQRIPHTFSYLQVEPAIDVMLKRFFDELPFQCTTTGLRFASREKLRKHHDALYRRRTLLQQRQRGAEARGWMETIPEWVGNRDLVVGPALFRLGSVGDEALKAQEAHRSLEEAASDAEDEERARWLCPMDQRRSVCPISGEAFARTWSASLNDWAYEDVVAVELETDKPLRFQPGGPGGPHGLSETAVLFKKSCFFNTPPSKRLQNLEECRTTHCLLGVEPVVEPPRPTPAADPELATLAVARPVPARFF